MWTPGHVLIGVFTRYAGLSPLAALGVWVVFEFLENTIAESEVAKRHIPTSGAETATNILGDLVANSLGYLTMDWWLSKSHQQSPFVRGLRR